MKFTIITVTYNAGDKLAETVTDCLKQTYTDYEILVKDGMSTDGSVEKLPADTRIRVERCKDSSIYDAMNQAVKMAQGDYVIFMNCGDFFHTEDVLLQVAKAIDKEPGRGIYYGDAYFCKAEQIMHMPPEITDYVCFSHIPCHQACVYAARLCKEKLGWSKTTTYTVIKRLSERGVLKTENTIVTALVSREQVQEQEAQCLASNPTHFW